MYALESSPLLLVSIVGAMGVTAKVLLQARPALLIASTPPTGEYISIAGLRGLLASSVLVHHAQISRAFFRDGIWMPPDNPVYSFAGTGSVSVFFMITGFLFWGKALDGKIQFLQLLKSRVRRIMPLYIFSVLVIFGICAYKSHFAAVSSASDIVISVIKWLGGGLLGRPEINGIGIREINCDVTWTLRYEWLFYFALPVMSVFATPRRFPLLIAVFLIALMGLKQFGYEDYYQKLVVAVPFFGGMLSAYAVRHRTGALFSRSLLVSAFVAASFIIGALAYRSGLSVIVTIALFPAFTAIALGDDIFGLLRLPSVRFLGEISFSVYLLHGIILMSALSLIDRFTPIGQMPFIQFVAICAGLGATVVLSSALTFTLVERRYMKGNAPRIGTLSKISPYQ